MSGNGIDFTDALNLASDRDYLLHLAEASQRTPRCPQTAIIFSISYLLHFPQISSRLPKVFSRKALVTALPPESEKIIHNVT